MTLSATLFSFPARVFALRRPTLPRLFAFGKELDPKTAMQVADLSPHLMKDIGVTDCDLGRKPMDRLPGL